jgi:site-specific DNA recombinase
MSKEWSSRGGASHAGKAFSKSLLSRLLTNVLYKGSISHKGTIYAGEHKAIVEHSLWEKVIASWR